MAPPRRSGPLCEERRGQRPLITAREGQGAGTGSKREAAVRPLRCWRRRRGAKEGREAGSDWGSPGEGWEWGQGRLGEQAEAQREARAREAGVPRVLHQAGALVFQPPTLWITSLLPGVRARALGWGPEAEL